ncbi:hypothetical protein GUJ93_ZPchr0009g230 [Zizania palustris]|uniref:Uncharacterized protein n=1 Tax=Zizania palustris TaxID=103762 RepID=A0A8J5RT03_ZIZPA|nr:hypothetical protein GUJ93_ZPchr0009g230 [Zizania palustris]
MGYVLSPSHSSLYMIRLNRTCCHQAIAPTEEKGRGISLGGRQEGRAMVANASSVRRRPRRGVSWQHQRL